MSKAYTPNNVPPVNVELKTELTYYTAPHEIVLNFNLDSDAELFEAWWVTIGKRLFEEYKAND